MRIVLVTHETVFSIWNEMLPMVQRCIDDAYDGEMAADDVLRDIAVGDAVAIVCIGDGEDIEMVGVFEKIHYPRMTVLNCCVLGASAKFATSRVTPDLIERIKDWAAAQGVAAIECQCSDALARLFNKWFGFTKRRNVCRVFLGERHHGHDLPQQV